MYHSVYFVKTTPPRKVYPHLFLCFFGDLSNKVAEKIASLFYFFSSTHMHPPGPYISAKSQEAAHCGRFGALGTKLNSKMARKAWLVFLSFFIYFARLVAIIGGSNSNNCRRYRFKTF